MKASKKILSTEKHNNIKTGAVINTEGEEEQKKYHTLLFNITSCLLLVQPDHSTVWADRRRCILYTISQQQQQHKRIISGENKNKKNATTNQQTKRPKKNSQNTDDDEEYEELDQLQLWHN